MGHATATVAEAPPATSIDTRLCWLMSRATHALTTEVQRALEELGLSARAHCVLSTASQGEYTQTELARLVDLDKTTMVVTMDELEAAGLAQRRPSTTDRRARVIAVTEAGERLVHEGERIVAGVQRDVLAVLDHDERATFVDALCKLTRDRLAVPASCSQPVRRPRSK